MTVRLNVHNFYQHYAFHPLSKDLSPCDRKIALVATLAFGVLTAGTFHLFFYNFFYEKDSLKFFAAWERVLPDSHYSHDFETLHRAASAYHHKNDFLRAFYYFWISARGGNDESLECLKNYRSTYEQLPVIKKTYQSFHVLERSFVQLKEQNRKKFLEKWEISGVYEFTEELYEAACNAEALGNHLEAMQLFYQGAKEGDDKSLHRLIYYRELYSSLEGGDAIYRELPSLQQRVFPEGLSEWLFMMKLTGEYKPFVERMTLYSDGVDYHHLGNFPKAMDLFFESAKKGQTRSLLCLEEYRPLYERLPRADSIYEALPSLKEKITQTRTKKQAERLADREKGHGDMDYEAYNAACVYHQQGNYQAAMELFYANANGLLKDEESFIRLVCYRTLYENLDGAEGIYASLPELHEKTKKSPKENFPTSSAIIAKQNGKIFQAGLEYHLDGNFVKALSLFFRAAKSGHVKSIQFLEEHRTTYEEVDNFKVVYPHLQNLSPLPQEESLGSKSSSPEDEDSVDLENFGHTYFEIALSDHRNQQYDSALYDLSVSLNCGHEGTVRFLQNNEALYRKKEAASRLPPKELYSTLPFFENYQNLIRQAEVRSRIKAWEKTPPKSIEELYSAVCDYHQGGDPIKAYVHFDRARIIVDERSNPTYEEACAKHLQENYSEAMELFWKAAKLGSRKGVSKLLEYQELYEGNRGFGRIYAASISLDSMWRVLVPK